MKGSFYTRKSQSDDYKRFGDTALTLDLERTEFEMHCEDVLGSLKKLKKDQKKLGDLAAYIQQPAIEHFGYEDQVYFSDDLKFAISIPTFHRNKAVLCRVKTEGMELEKIKEVFTSRSRIVTVLFNSISTFVVIACEEKCAGISLITNQEIFVIKENELDSRNRKKSISKPRLLVNSNEVHIVPYLSETSLVPEDLVWFDLFDGKILFLDLRKWLKDPLNLVNSIQITLKEWDDFVEMKEVDEIQLFSPNSMVVFLRDVYLEVFLLELDLNLDQVKEKTQSVKFVNVLKQRMTLKRKVIPAQSKQLARHTILLKAMKESEVEEFFSLEYNEGQGLVVSELIEMKSSASGKIFAFYGLKYLITTDSEVYKGKKSRLMRVFIRNGGKYDPFVTLNPFNEKVRSGPITMVLTTDRKSLVVNLQTEEGGSQVAVIKAPFPGVLTCLACIPKTEIATRPNLVGPSGVQLFDLDCNFEELQLVFEKEPNCVATQSQIEDFGVMSIQNGSKLRSLSLFRPSNMRFFKKIEFKGSNVEDFSMDFVIKIMSKEAILLASKIRVQVDGVSMMVHDKVYSLDYTTGVVELVVSNYESISRDGHHIFYKDKLKRTVIMKNMLIDKEIDLEMNLENKRFDVFGGKVVCWNRAKSHGNNTMMVMSVNEERVKVEFQTQEKEDLGTQPIFARNRELILLILKEEFVLIQVRSMKVSKLRIPSEIDSGADIEAVTISMDECHASFVYKSFLDVMIYILRLEDTLKITAARPPPNTKDMLMVGSKTTYLMTKDRKYNLEPTTLRFFPLADPSYHSTVNVEISRFRSLEESNYSNQGRKRYVLSGDTVEFVRVENIRVSGSSHKHFSTSSFLVKYKISFCDSSLFCMELIFDLIRGYFSAGTREKKHHMIDNIIGIIKVIRPQIVELHEVYTAIVYHLDSSYAMKKYLEIVGIEELVVRDRILTMFYHRPRALSGEAIIGALQQFARLKHMVPVSDEESIVEFILKRGGSLLKDDITKDLIKLLIFAPTAITIQGSLVSAKKNFLALPFEPHYGDRFESRRKDMSGPATYPRLAAQLLSKEPHKARAYRVYESKILLDLENGSPFSISLFELVQHASDEDILDRYSVLIYHKWNKLFRFVLTYCMAFWFMTIISYLFLGDMVRSRALGCVGILINSAFILFEFKMIVSRSIGSRNVLGNVLELCLHIMTIGVSLAVMINLDRLDAAIMNWARLATVIVLTIRAISFMRIFGPLRYIIRMLYEVLSSLPPFITVLVTVIFMWAFAWSLHPILEGGPEEAATLAFPEALQTAFGLLIDVKPGGEEGRLPPLQFVFVVVGHCLIIVTMLNFLIAQIVHTFEESYHSKVLHDVKELLTYIREFDTFFSGSFDGLAGENSKKCRYITLVEEGKQDQIKDLRHFITNEMREMEGRLGKKIEEKHDVLEQKLNSLIRGIEHQESGQKNSEGSHGHHSKTSVKKKSSVAVENEYDMETN